MARKSRAVSSQGTEFAMSQYGATSVDVTITGISLANPAVVTATAHGLVTGDIVDISGVAGMTEINGQGGLVKKLTDSTFAVYGIDSTNYSAWTSGGVATPAVMISTCQHKSYSGFDGAASEIDITTLCSTAKEKDMGLQDAGAMSAELNYVEDDAFQIEAKIAKRDANYRWFRLKKRNGYFKVWLGQVTSFGDSGSVDGVNTGTLSVSISGEVSEAI